jgi:nucleoside-diphosphate-sugar epimerase
LRAPDEAAYETANCRGVENLCQALRRAKAKLRRFVLISSLAAAGPARPGEKITDVQNARPLSLYGKSKLAGEKTLSRYGSDFPIAILRPPAIYGPRDRSFYPFFRLARRHVCLVPGNPGMRLSALHVEDVVEAAVLADEKKEAVGRTFLLSDDHPRTLEEFAKSLVRTVTDFCLPLYVSSGLVRFVSRNSAFLAEVFGIPQARGADKLEELCAGSWSADDSQAHRCLGFRPRWELEQGLKDAYLWYTSMGW